MEMKECRKIGLQHNKKIKDAVKIILEEIGENPEREGLKRTPFRVAKAYEEWFGGYGFEAKDVLNREFADSTDLVVEGPIHYYSHCEHHITPFFGEAWIAYIPNGKVTGLDKLVKLVEIYARRLQIQERMTQEIADGLFDNLNPKGVMVVVKGKHLCISSRETRNDTTETITSALRGVFETDASAKAEVLEFIKILGDGK